MEETFPSLVCFQAPLPWSQFTLCSLKGPNDDGRAAGLCCPQLGDEQSWWAQAGKARKRAGTGLCGCTEACRCLHIQTAKCAAGYPAVCALLPTGAARFLPVREPLCATSPSTCPPAGWGGSCVFTRVCKAASGPPLYAGSLYLGSQGVHV